MKALETMYSGVRFRSRTEARWAIFFDAIGIAWEYEAEPMFLPSSGVAYLPDFTLPGMGLFVEVKATGFDADSWPAWRWGYETGISLVVGPPFGGWGSRVSYRGFFGERGCFFAQCPVCKKVGFEKIDNGPGVQPNSGHCVCVPLDARRPWSITSSNTPDLNVAYAAARRARLNRQNNKFGVSA